MYNSAVRLVSSGRLQDGPAYRDLVYFNWSSTAELQIVPQGKVSAVAGTAADAKEFAKLHVALGATELSKGAAIDDLSDFTADEVEEALKKMAQVLADLPPSCLVMGSVHAHLRFFHHKIFALFRLKDEKPCWVEVPNATHTSAGFAFVANGCSFKLSDDEMEYAVELPTYFPCAHKNQPVIDPPDRFNLVLAKEDAPGSFSPDEPSFFTTAFIDGAKTAIKHPGFSVREIMAAGLNMYKVQDEMRAESEQRPFVLHGAAPLNVIRSSSFPLIERFLLRSIEFELVLIFTILSIG